MTLLFQQFPSALSGLLNSSTHQGRTWLRPARRVSQRTAQPISRNTNSPGAWLAPGRRAPWIEPATPLPGRAECRNYFRQAPDSATTAINAAAPYPTAMRFPARVPVSAGLHFIMWISASRAKPHRMPNSARCSRYATDEQHVSPTELMDLSSVRSLSAALSVVFRTPGRANTRYPFRRMSAQN